MSPLFQLIARKLELSQETDVELFEGKFNYEHFEKNERDRMNRLAFMSEKPKSTRVRLELGTFDFRVRLELGTFDFRALETSRTGTAQRHHVLCEQRDA